MWIPPYPMWQHRNLHWTVPIYLPLQIGVALQNLLFINTLRKIIERITLLNKTLKPYISYIDQFTKAITYGCAVIISPNISVVGKSEAILIIKKSYTIPNSVCDVRTENDL